MKKLIVALLIGISIGIGVFFTFISQSQNTPQPSQDPSQNSQQTQPEAEQESEETAIIANPEIVRIPRLGVEAIVEHVGLDSQKRMDVPKDYQNVAWYELGYAPGETGSAVIAGHFDTPQGTAGVFYGIRSLQPGDEIIVEGNNISLTYEVTNIEIYQFDQVPLEEVFNSTDTKRLNLITCDGIFDQSAQNYSQRLIVYAVLTE